MAGGKEGAIEVIVCEIEAQGARLRNGTEVTVRPICPNDAPRLQALFARLSSESIFFRFLGHCNELAGERAEDLANVDYQTQMAFVATHGQGNEVKIIAVARYALLQRNEPDLAEAAIVVEDRHQGQGLGTLLLKRLAEYAREHGIRAFLATVHQANTRILRFIERSGLPVESNIDSGVWEILVDLDTEPECSAPRNIDDRSASSPNGVHNVAPGDEGAGGKMDKSAGYGQK